MTVRSRKLFLGIMMLAAFVGGLVIMFLPIFAGQNALDYLDSLYNSISKGSADYFPALEEDVARHDGERFAVTLNLKNGELAAAAAELFEEAGAAVEVEGTRVKAIGDLAETLRSCLADARQMFENETAGIEVRYGRGAKATLFTWWSALKAMDRDLTKQNRFEQAALVSKLTKKGVECAYNYYGIEPLSIYDNLGIVVLSLAFYVFYTIWYGYAVILLFEGFGLWLSH